ncbi:MAG: polyprenol phosphomannose-dependent alpha 1,6 mannosyltransferase MptB [Acidimicrobiales bacterium]
MSSGGTDLKVEASRDTEDRVDATATSNGVLALFGRVFVSDYSYNWRWLNALRSRVDSRFARWRRPVVASEPYVPGVTKLGVALWRSAIMGFVASVAIFLGATQQGSPFTSKLPGAWFFGIPPQPAVAGYQPAPGQGLFLGVIAVYGGMFLMIGAWYDVVKIVSTHRGFPVARLVPVFVAWVLPMLFVAPLFSKDVYAYAAQGEMMSHGINPYLYGTNVIGATSFSRLADPLWGNVTSPYGPMFLVIDGWIVTLAHHNLLASVVGLRMLDLLGVVLMAVSLPAIAKSFGRDESTAFALAVLNPLIILNLIAGAHNDALMIGLLTAGFALSRRGHPVWGIIVCGFAASVKVPAIIGALYIGWEWLGQGRSIRERIRPTATALILALATMAGVSEGIGLGWGWISGLTNPDVVRSWLDPATGVGLAFGHLAHTIGLGQHTHLLLTVTRGTSFALAFVIALRLLMRSDRIGPARAMGWSLFAFVLLGPVVQPWYASWGFVFLALVAEGRVRRVLIFFSGVSCFLQMPGGRDLLRDLSAAHPTLIIGAALVLALIATAYLLPKFRHLFPPGEELAQTG